MKKTLKVLIFSFVAMAMVVCTSVMSASAAVKDPLADMKSSYKMVKAERTEMGGDFITEEYKSKITLSVSSSKKSVATAKVYNEKDGKKYYSAFEIIPKGAGTTTFTVKATIDGKTFEKKCKVTIEKYVNPFSSFSIGGKSYMKQLNKSNVLDLKSKYITGKIKYKVKSGYKVTGTYAFTTKSEYKVKTGMKLKDKTTYMGFMYKNTKSKVSNEVVLSSANNF